ncbi:hypothetical protein DDB_G0268300 [Dictyostelium discoideum AX4]|uniref:Putative uncharacterized protein DDB_G0268300 n=1 Tax=Dictyostelium discoideum TaxID=44689 RepID=Y2099_DICDI|nr:hypothetical protein DDB_G0268300 [Dictyostelium discoideum AX4]Q55GK1.1 RecName: Full=Putative uncharacterized protein DDB_G0268300 [Dictyostelium discoideum]EAL73603.1 hypothetical protein DDB_G0268300 [Dictyostelium discoideum AX4]|eukprot:XP_647183.1 hypothetical protein DDB_G0268300 [Dictyostelium discoideum AX4]
MTILKTINNLNIFNSKIKININQNEIAYELEHKSIYTKNSFSKAGDIMDFYSWRDKNYPYITR